MKPDIYQRITDQIVTQLESGVRPWMQPWNSAHADGRIIRPLRHNGEPYNGINVLMLWSAAEAKGFTSPTWMTFRQAQEVNAHVRKGEQGRALSSMPTRLCAPIPTPTPAKSPNAPFPS